MQDDFFNKWHPVGIVFLMVRFRILRSKEIIRCSVKYFVNFTLFSFQRLGPTLPFVNVFINII